MNSIKVFAAVFTASALLSVGVAVSLDQVWPQQEFAKVRAENVPDYQQVVRDPLHSDRIIGHLAGEGQRITGAGSETSHPITFDVSEWIAAASYPIPWIAQMQDGTGALVPLRGISVQFANGAITTNSLGSDGTYFPVYLHSDWITAPATQVRAELWPGAGPDYRVVRDKLSPDRIVGQLAGEGTKISGLGLDSRLPVALALAGQAVLDQRGSYPVPGVARLTPDTADVLALRGISVHIEDGSFMVDGMSADGIYFPVYLEANWAEDGSAAPSLPSSSLSMATAMPSTIDSGLRSTSSAIPRRSTRAKINSGLRSTSSAIPRRSTRAHTTFRPTAEPLDNGTPTPTSAAKAPTTKAPAPVTTVTPKSTAASARVLCWQLVVLIGLCIMF